MKHLANALTVNRMVLSVVLLFLPAFSVGFFILYTLCGLSDMLDGTVARRTGTASEKGARLDSLADLVFVGACLIRILPQIAMPGWLWVLIGLIVLIRIGNLICGYTQRRKLILSHTVANKVTGTLLFLLPFMIRSVPLLYLALPITAVSLFAALQEGHFIRRSRKKFA